MKKFFSVLIFVLCLVLFFFAGFSLGKKDLQKQNETIKAVGAPDISIVWEAWKTIKDNYFGKTDNQKQTYGLIDGLVFSLDDSYSVFMEPGQNKRFLDDLSGNLEGIGAELEIKNQMLVVVAPLEGSPAQKSGLKAKDIIYKINGEETSKMTFEDAIDKIRGKAGTNVTLTILRENAKEPLEFKITRAKIAIKSVESKIRDDKIAYIKINQFNEDTADLVKTAADDLSKKDLKGIVLDLRNNPGGYFGGSIDIASLFIDPGIVAYEENKKGEQKEFKSTSQPILKKFKTVVLVNNGSASASEIVAGALRDREKIKLVGEKTFGKGSVQTIEPLSDGSSIRLTTAKWLTPNKTMINGEGLKPDIEIKLTDDDIKNNKDPQLDKAIEIINQK